MKTNFNKFISTALYESFLNSLCYRAPSAIYKIY